MTTLATHNPQASTTGDTLFVAFELSEKTWKLGFTTGHGQKPHERTVSARQQERGLDEIARAKDRLGLPASAAVVSCYEAGREGFWLHRFLQGHGITNHVVDSSAIEVNRRRRRAKKQIPRSSRRNPLPVKRINGSLLMGHEYLARAAVELMQIEKTSSGSDHVLQHAPKAFNGVEVVATMGR
jgi:transposase